MNMTIQGPCQTEKTAKKEAKTDHWGRLFGRIRHEPLGKFPNSLSTPPETCAATGVGGATDQKGMTMLGKLAGAWLGSKIAGRHEGTKGAVLGYGAAALARRSVPALAAVALGGWLFNKWRERRREPSYPSDASPSSPAG
jgi:hypothetical protein